MHNGCLLLLAFVAVLQPIASYTERGLVDGRQQRCDYRTSLRDPGAYLHGTYRFTKPTVEERRLSTREHIREARRNEIRGESLPITSSDRRLVDTLERNRNVLTRPSRDRVGNEAILRRENRDTRHVANRRDEHNLETRRERLSTVQENQFNRQDSRLFGNENRHQSRIDNRRSNEPRVSVESRRDTRSHGTDAQAQRAKESRQIRMASNGAREDVASRLTERRIAREEAQRMDTRRSVSRIQFNRNVDREVLNRRTRNSDFRSSSMSSDRVNRAFNNEDSRLVIREDNRSLDRERRTVSSRRSVDQVRQLRDISRIQHQSLIDERRNIRDSANQRNVRGPHERTSENRREARIISQPQSTERNSRIKEVRSVDDSRIQSARRYSRISERARSAENQIDLNEARRMNEIRSLERNAENRMESRKPDRVRLSESRNYIRQIERESETILNNRAAGNLRDTRLVERNLKGTDRVREETRNNNRDTCAFARVRSTERRLAGMMIRENDRNSQIVERDNRIRGIDGVNQRDNQIHREIRFVNRQQSENRREAREVQSEVFRAKESRGLSRNVDRTFRTERTDESRRQIRNSEFRAIRTDENRRNARSQLRAIRSARVVNNLRGSRTVRSERFVENQRDSVERAFRTERTVETRRDTRNIDSRTVRNERPHESRRDIQSIDSRAFRMERTDGNRREAHTADSRASRAERTAYNRREVRDFQRQTQSLERDQYQRVRLNNERDARIQDRTIESRQNIRNIETRSRTENERVIGNRRARSLEREVRSFERERFIKNARMISRNSRTSVLESERDTENRRDARSTRTQSRSSDPQESRRVESRVNNLVRSRDDAMKRLSKRDSLDSRRNYNLHRESRRETRRTSERDNLVTLRMDAQTSSNTEYAGKREVQIMFQSPEQSYEETPTMNWQYLLYTLQGLYICGVLMQLMDERSVEKKTRASWWPVRQHLIKVD